MGEPLPTRSPGRMRWLAQLARDGFGHRPRGRVGYDCMQLGWTTWLYQHRASGRHLTTSEVQLERNWGTSWDDFENIGEVLTEEGRRILREEE